LSIGIDGTIKFCYFELMQEEFIRKAKKYIKQGSFIAVVLSILITLFLYYLYRYSFICYNPRFCGE